VVLDYRRQLARLQRERFGDSAPAPRRAIKAGADALQLSSAEVRRRGRHEQRSPLALSGSRFERSAMRHKTANVAGVSCSTARL
jgi:hypothetical protein